MSTWEKEVAMNEDMLYALVDANQYKYRNWAWPSGYAFTVLTILKKHGICTMKHLLDTSDDDYKSIKGMSDVRFGFVKLLQKEALDWKNYLDGLDGKVG